MKIVFATNNSHKLEELRKICGPDWEIVGLKDIGFSEDIPENGLTLQENALEKARFINKRYGLDCFADDTGLEVEALDGAPGVYSARYAGEGHDANANMEKLLAEMDGKTNRKAAFRTVIALVLDGKEYLFNGEVTGHITETRHGSEGFGYDPLFMPDGWNKTFAEASAEEKNAISHRGRAVRKLIDFLSEKINHHRV